MAKAHRPAQHGGAGKMHLARFEHDCFVKGMVIVPFVLPVKIRSSMASRGICIVKLLTSR